jgi:hypothetical protein
MLASTSQEEPNLSRDAVSSSRTWPCSKRLGQCITIRALRLALGEMIGPFLVGQPPPNNTGRVATRYAACIGLWAQRAARSRLHLIISSLKVYK